ncbi:RseA family anti-sigma factor [Thaumasiovibrio sp. DFM-14]|uniref:RseA family anti-sigma factor n=1 Tax=Thaumasiovibrio sp. DFM-14 TaxID=3384792 RepID=UPI0039A2B9CF
MKKQEMLSALVDGELQDEILLDALAEDGDSAAHWQNYHLIGDVMRGDAPQSVDWDISAQIARALDDEPAHMQKADNVEPIESQPKPEQVRKTLPAWLRNLGQVATAACVSLVAIVGVQQYNGAQDDTMLTSSEAVSVLETVPFAGTVQPVSLSTRPQTVSQQVPSEAQLVEQRRRINAMLQDYELQLRLNAEDGTVDRSRLEQQVQATE